MCEDVPLNQEQQISPKSSQASTPYFQQWDHTDPWCYPPTHIPQSVSSVEYDTDMDEVDYRRTWDDDFGWYIDSSTANFDRDTGDWEHLAAIANYYEDQSQVRTGPRNLDSNARQSKGGDEIQKTTESQVEKESFLQFSAISVRFHEDAAVNKQFEFLKLLDG